MFSLIILLEGGIFSAVAVAPVCSLILIYPLDRSYLNAFPECDF